MRASDLREGGCLRPHRLCAQCTTAGLRRLVDQRVGDDEESCRPESRGAATRCWLPVTTRPGCGRVVRGRPKTGPDLLVECRTHSGGPVGRAVSSFSLSASSVLGRNAPWPSLVASECNLRLGGLNRGLPFLPRCHCLTAETPQVLGLLSFRARLAPKNSVYAEFDALTSSPFFAGGRGRTITDQRDTQLVEPRRHPVDVFEGCVDLVDRLVEVGVVVNEVTGGNFEKAGQRLDEVQSRNSAAINEAIKVSAGSSLDRVRLRLADRGRRR